MGKKKKKAKVVADPRRVRATIFEGPVQRIAWKWAWTPDWKEMIEKARMVGGSRFSKEGKCWTAPATIETCHALRRAYGDELLVSPLLAEWFVKHDSLLAAQTAASAATDAELRLLPKAAPRLFRTLRPDQRAGVAWIAEGYRGAGLVADKPGLGKTLETIGGLLEADVQGPILVICPKISVRNVWQRELLRWTKKERVYAARGTRAQREKVIAEFLEDTSSRKWLIIVAEMLRVKRLPNDTEVKANAKRRGRVAGYEYPDLFALAWGAIVADESQRMLGSLTVAKSNLMGEGLAKLSLARGGRKYALSGTPFGRGGRVHGMFGTLHWLWPDEYTSFWRWAGTYFDIEEEYVKRGRVAKKIIGLKTGTAEEFLHTLGPRILRRTKEEVLPNLPPKQYVEVLCEMEPEQRRQYKQLGDDAEISVPGGTIIANGVLAEITRARQIANGVVAKQGKKVVFTGTSCKVEALMEKLETRGLLDDSGDTKVIISSQYNEFLKGVVLPRLEKEGVAYHLMTGVTSDKKRDEAMDTFQGSGGPRVFVLNSKAGGVSVTLDAADEVHCLDELDNPEDNEQLEDRAHRASRMHQVTIFYYRTEGTYDTNVAASVENKRKEQFKVLDGRRGLKDVREWIKYREEK